MRPRITLYDEHGSDDVAVDEVIKSDLKGRYDVFIVAGTGLKGIRSVQDIVRNMRSRVDSMLWINTDPPPVIPGVTWDHTFQGPCDVLAKAYMDSKSQAV